MRKTIPYAWKNIRRSPYQALSAITVLATSFFIAQLFSLISVGSHEVLQYFETKPQISAYFTDETTEAEIMAHKQTLESNPNIAEVTYISKLEALSIYKEQNKDDTLLLEMVTADILPASLEISPASLDVTLQIRDQIDQLPGLEELVYQQDVIETLTSWTRGVRFFGISLLAFLIFTSVLMVVIIVGMKVASKRHEIRIMQLLGASKWFIVGPFLFEGAAYGLLGSFLAWGANYIGLLYATPYLIDFLGDIPLLPLDPIIMLVVFGVTASIGIVIGMVGGSIAVKRYIKH